jgi:hypothetical protein
MLKGYVKLVKRAGGLCPVDYAPWIMQSAA